VRERDPFLRRFERDAILACMAMAAVALVVPRGGPWEAAAVVGGGGLAAASYRAIKGAVDAVAGGGTRTASLVKFFTRHGILAVAAYVMLVRLRLHPVGVLVGASSLFASAAVAAARALLPAPRSGHPRS
jgi:hypothetical protein